MPYDPRATRGRIVDAAVTELAERGPAGARVERIARAARVNKQAIYHYFGSKERLVSEVLSHRLDDLAAAVDLQPDGVAEYAADLFDFHVEHPDVIRLVLWEALAARSDAREAGDQRHLHYQTKVDAIAKAQELGNVDADLDARQLLLALLSLVNWQFAAPQVADAVWSTNGGVTPSQSERREFVVRMARSITGRG